MHRTPPLKGHGYGPASYTGSPFPEKRMHFHLNCHGEMTLLVSAVATLPLWGSLVRYHASRVVQWFRGSPKG